MTKVASRRGRKAAPRPIFKRLLEIYGGLLTDKQYALAAGHHIKGRSFSDIAREHEISRQAVHEAVRSVEVTLKYYDDNLKLSSGGGKSGKADGNIKLAAEKLRQLRKKVTQKGIIYSVDWIVQDINEIIEFVEPGSEK